MLRTLLSAAVLATAALAQTSTDCNPLNVTCPPDTALGISNYTWSVGASGGTQVDYGVWNNTGGLDVGFDSSSAMFTISKSGNAPGIKSQFYYFFGTVSVIMKASPGTGIISAVTSLSDDLDEIDWEFKGGNSSFVFTNFYGKYRPGMDGVGTDVPLSFDPRADFHNYTTVWSNSSIQWMVDGNVVRTLNSDDPSTGNGSHFPQTPMQLHIGSWAAGDPSEPQGVQEWAGGATDYSQAPFSMHVSQVYVSDASTGSTYTYSDKTGSAGSIQIAPGNSTVANYLAQKEVSSGGGLDGHISNLSSGAKIGIAIAAIVVAALAVIVLAVCCIKQRRAGRRERAVADAEFQKQEADLMAYRMDQAQRPGQMPGFGYEEFKGKR